MKGNILLVSLAANVLLGLWIFCHPTEGPSATQQSFSTMHESEATRRDTLAEHQPAPWKAEPDSEPDVFFWSKLESSDLAEYARNLRGIRCPEMVVKTVVNAEIERRYRPKVFEIASTLRNDFYEKMAKAHIGFEKLIKEQLDGLEKLEHEMSGLRENALKGDPVPDSRRARPDTARMAEMADYLRPEQSARVLEITDQYSLKRDKVNREKNSAELLKDFEEQEQSDLRFVLSDEQFAEYNLRKGLFGSSKTQRPTFNATEEEWRRIVELEVAARKTNAQGVQMDYEIAKILGPERGEEFKRHGDNDFKNFVEITQEVGLPENNAIVAVEIQKEAQAEKEQIEKQSLPEAFKDQMIQSWRTQTVSKIEAVLGKENTDAYVYRHGMWITLH